MTTYNQNGQYDLNRLELIIPEGDRIDLSSIYIDISLYESILTPTMSGSVSIIDTNNLYNFNMLGNGEEILIDFNTSGSDVSIVFHGVVYKTSPPARVSEHSSGIVLHFVSKEMINSNRTIIGDSFNAESSVIVSDVFNRIRNVKNIDIVRSKNIHHFVSASHKPIELISDLAGRSESTMGEYGYLFYENNKEFVFAPIEFLYNTDILGQYFYSNSGVYNDVNKKEEEAFNNIQNYEIVSVSDLLEQIDDGVYGSRVSNLNLLDKEIVDIEYDNVSNFRKDRSVAKVPNLRNLVNSNMDDRTEVRYWPTNESFHKTRFYNLRTLLNSQRYAANISVFGDTTNKVGATIECVLPVWGTEAQKNGDVPDPYSGKCLIMEIKHTLQRTKYIQTMKLIKDSFEAGA
ncbi:MAG: hypothetical protein R3230_00870 [Nitrosopumilaceae archaeon]|nr:hypothetical protein [Nitrosopumilaceae archaeon]